MTQKKSAKVNNKKKKSFKRTMDQAKSHMNIVQRSFSTIIHTRPIETASDILAATLLRPLPVVTGLLGMIATLLIFYGTAKYIGYNLSGYEGLSGFIIGWIVGLIIDFVKLTNHKN